MFWFWVFFFSFILAKTATVEDGKSSYQKKKKTNPTTCNHVEMAETF